jgi:hypothetical protein
LLAAAGLVAASATAAQADPIICTTVNDVWDVNPEGVNRTAVSYPTIAWNNVSCDFRVDESWNNPAVTLLQYTLNTCYGPYAKYQFSHRGVTRQLTTEGKYGPNTRAAVKEFQTWYNNNHGGADLTADGYAGPMTRSKMTWVSNGLYGAKCSNVPLTPTITAGAPAPVRQFFPESGNCSILGHGKIGPWTLHGNVQVHLWTSRCNGAVQAEAVNAPQDAVLSIDRTAFAAPSSCDPCYIKSYEIGANHSDNPRYHFWDQGNDRKSNNNLVTPFIDGTLHYVRACLLHNGYYECVNDWYADED